MVLHVVRRRLIRRRDSRRAILSMLGAVLRGELDVPERTKNAFPATFHFDLLPHARGAGLGGRLFRLFVRRMQALGVPGIHGQVLSLNRPVQEFLHRVGCRMVAARPTGAYQHIVREPVEVQTWVLPL
jgi:GNAT superfamily N-acetyltransferase